MALVTNIFKEHLNTVFIETGSYKGDGIQCAIEAGFNDIYSFEATKVLYDHCLNRFWDNFNVHLFYGDSRKYLPLVLSWHREPITFWLDAHSCGDAYFDHGAYPTFDSQPLMKELEIIKSHPIKTHTLIIDDMVYYRGKALTNAIMAINPDYKIKFVDGNRPNDILIAKV